VCIGIIGSVDTIYGYIENNIGFGILIISMIIHLLLLIVLIDFDKYGKLNTLSIFLLFIANLIILFLPYWPYSIKRESTALLYNIIYILLYFAYLDK
jgi:hypothetical protein